MIGRYADIKYVIKIGNELYLQSIDRKGVHFTKRENEAKTFVELEGIENMNDVAKQVQDNINQLFELGIRDTRVVGLETTVEHREHYMQFEFVMTPDFNTLRLIPVKGE